MLSRDERSHFSALLIGGGTLTVLALNFAIWAACLWLVGSLAASGVKTFRGECGARYGIEKVVSGDWFCPVK